MEIKSRIDYIHGRRQRRERYNRYASLCFPSAMGMTTNKEEILPGTKKKIKEKKIDLRICQSPMKHPKKILKLVMKQLKLA